MESTSTPFKAKFQDKECIVTVYSDGIVCRNEKSGETYFECDIKKIRLLRMITHSVVLLNWDDNTSQIVSAQISARHARKIHDCIRENIQK